VIQVPEQHIRADTADKPAALQAGQVAATDMQGPADKQEPEELPVRAVPAELVVPDKPAVPDKPVAVPAERAGPELSVQAADLELPDPVCLLSSNLN
jgi:hypothetical protein